MTPRGTLELCCVHIAQLMTNDSSGYLHTPVYLAVMLQTSWHSAEGS